MPLVAISIKLDRVDEELLYQAADGSYWLSCVCVFDTDAKGRTIVAQSIPKERYAAGERGPQVGYWREIGGASKPLQSGKATFDLSRYKAAAQPKPPDQGAYPQGEESLPPAQEAQQEHKPHGFEPGRAPVKIEEMSV